MISLRRKRVSALFMFVFEFCRKACLFASASAGRRSFCREGSRFFVPLGIFCIFTFSPSMNKTHIKENMRRVLVDY